MFYSKLLSKINVQLVFAVLAIAFDGPPFN